MKSLFFIPVFLLLLNQASIAQERLPQPRNAEQVLNEEYCTGLFRAADGTYFDMLNDRAAIGATAYLNILDWLQGRVAGLQVQTAPGNVRVPFIRNIRAAIYVDEMPMSASYLNMLPVADIAMIKIIKGPFAVGFGAPGGVIAIYTIRAEEEED